MGSIAQMADRAAWLAMITSGWNDMGHTTFWVALLKIMWINILLSGDNAVVIAMACRGLPHRQRVWGMVLGAGVAVGNRGARARACLAAIPDGRYKPRRSGSHRPPSPKQVQWRSSVPFRSSNPMPPLAT